MASTGACGRTGAARMARCQRPPAGTTRRAQPQARKCRHSTRLSRQRRRRPRSPRPPSNDDQRG
eukprot:3755887-Pleurochrysis_carterae.AAC.1